MKLWIARDRDGSLWVYESKPILDSKKEYFIIIEENFGNSLSTTLPEKWFPEITFENSPRQVELNYVMNGL